MFFDIYVHLKNTFTAPAKLTVGQGGHREKHFYVSFISSEFSYYQDIEVNAILIIYGILTICS